jgi:FkbM family methyltransferase
MLANHLKRSKFRLKQWAGYEPRVSVQINCPVELHGSNYAGWYICPSDWNQESVFYSFGIGEDISFDLSIIQTFGVTVHAFDPTPRSIQWVRAQTLPASFKFWDFGIAGFDGLAQFNPPENPEHVSHTLLERPETSKWAIQVPVYRLKTIMTKLGHDRIDVLKMDIEGAEYSVIDDLLYSNIRVEQILVEFHHRFKNVGRQQTEIAIAKLNQAGFRIFSISPSGKEYSLISR